MWVILRLVPEPAVFVDLRFSPGVDLVSVVRRFVLHFCRQAVDDSRLVSRTAVAAHELLENVVRYAATEEARIWVGLKSGAQGGVITIRTWNRASAERVATVASLIDAMTAAADPSEYYRALMIRSAKSSGSGLGLGRVFAETDMTLSHSVDGDLLMIQAVSERKEGGRL
jgi:hypothetical protein